MAKPRARAKPGEAPVERRSGVDRRTQDDRRFFPRPEGRRKTGRRATDPKD
jgi:hypothetical protein